MNTKLYNYYYPTNNQTLIFHNYSEKGVRFIYGKWTEFIKCTDYDSYEEYLKENTHKFKRSERSKSPNESPAHTPRKVLSKLNSLKMASFRSLSIQDVSSTPDFYQLFIFLKKSSQIITIQKKNISPKIHQKHPIVICRSATPHIPLTYHIPT